MKYLFLLFTLIFSASGISAQVLNDQINFEIRFAEFYGSSDNDATSTDEQSMLITTVRTDDSGDQVVGPFCTTFDCHAPCTALEDVDAGPFNFSFYTGVPANSTIDFQLDAWGDEGDPECSFNGDDQDFFSGTASEDALSNPEITTNRFPVLWYTDFGSNDGFIFSAAAPYNLKPQVVWSYDAGDDCGNVLNFGTIATGETKTHLNSNRAAPPVLLGNARIGYANLYTSANHNSPDVYYSFTLTQPSMVRLSTDNPGTDYDTYMTLLSGDCSTVLAFNDDEQENNVSLASTISIMLEPGVYNVIIEGFDLSVGNFELSITATEVVSTTDINPELPLKIGPNPTDGRLNISTSDPTLLQDATIEVISLQGQVLQRTEFNDSFTTLDLGQYPAGMYLVRVVTEAGQMSRKVTVY